MDRTSCLLLLAVLSASAQHYITAAVSLPITTGSSGNVGEVLAGKIHSDTDVSNALAETDPASAESGEGTSNFELVRRRTNFRGDLGKRIGGNGGRRNGAWNPFSTGRLRPDLGKRTGSSEMAEASWPWRRIQRGNEPQLFEPRPSTRRRLRPDLGKRSEGDENPSGELRGYLWRPSLSELPSNTGLYVDDIRPEIAQRWSDDNDERRFSEENNEGSDDVDDDVLEQAVMMIQRRALPPAASRSGTRANHFRGDLGKRRPPNTFRGDLGKRSDESILFRRRRRSIDAINDEQNDDDLRNFDVEDDNMAAENDKRSGRGGNDNARKSFRGDLGKRRNSFRGDLGKRSRGGGVLSGSTYGDSTSVSNGGVKRKQSKSFRGDLGKRSPLDDVSSAAEDGGFKTSSSMSFVKRPRQQFRGDLGKRDSTPIEAAEELNLSENKSH